MWKAALVALLVARAPVDQEPVRTVAAVEIRLQSDADRRDLLAMFRRHAAASGLHVDDVSARWREFEAESGLFPPEQRGTFHVGIWRGENDDEQEVSADDRFHPGRVWVTFSRGRQPDRSTRIREALLADIRLRWPEARALPVLPMGNIPFADDLVMTEGGYRVARSAAERYELPPASPLVAPR